MLRSAVLLYRGAGESSIVGAEVPSFERFPYKAKEVLRLYREFWRLLYRHPPQDRPDLMFRLRNEFRSKRHLAGSRAVVSALRRGEGILEVQRTAMESRLMRQSGMVKRDRGSQSVDGLFDQLQSVAGHVLPGLRNYKPSLPLNGDRYAAVGSNNVNSCHRPVPR